MWPFPLEINSSAAALNTIRSHHAGNRPRCSIRTRGESNGGAVATALVVLSEVDNNIVFEHLCTSPLLVPSLTLSSINGKECATRE